MMSKNDRFFITLFLFLIFLTNYPLILGISNQQFYLDLDFINTNKFLTLFTHPFAHLSIYHLVTDMIVFLLLYFELSSLKNISKYKIMVGCWVFSSFIAFLSLPLYSVSTFGGLSGINYGILAYICLSNATNLENSFFFRAGSALFLLFLIVKQVLESCFHLNFIHEMHLGYVGIPISESHAGGMLAALTLFWVSFKQETLCKTPESHTTDSLAQQNKYCNLL